MQYRQFSSAATCGRLFFYKVDTYQSTAEVLWRGMRVAYQFTIQLSYDDAVNHERDALVKNEDRHVALPALQKRNAIRKITTDEGACWI